MRLLPAGDGAFVVEVDGSDDVLALAAAARADPGPALVDLVDLVPAERTLLVTFRPGRGRARAVAGWLRSLRPDPAAVPDGPAVVLDVVYDGDDLAEVAALAGMSPGDVVEVHTGLEWRVAFTGFAPGFGYLRPAVRPEAGGPAAALLAVPRRAEPRARVPAGSVALAAGYGGVYPRPSPGGWQLVGRTERRLWQPDRDPPALLRPGTRVRFRPIDAASPPSPSPPSPSPPSPPSPSPLAAPGAGAGPGSARGLDVVAAGPLTTVQDLGRPGWAHLGVSGSGAADRGALRLANRLVGNPEGAAGLEVTVGGLAVRARGDLLVAVTGAACPVTLDGVPSPTRAVLALRSGAELRLGPAVAGVRAYLAVRGGLAVPTVLGSAATDLLGGLGPAPVADGDRLPVGRRTAGWPVVDVAPVPEPPAGTVRLHATPGPRADGSGGPGGRRSLLEGVTWRVADDSDRVGLRLEGPGPALPAGATVPSEGVVRGAVQLPPGGRPVIFLADHPVTGGYPVVAVLRDADVDAAAQLRPGQPVVLRLVGPA